MSWGTQRLLQVTVNLLTCFEADSNQEDRVRVARDSELSTQNALDHSAIGRPLLEVEYDSEKVHI